MNKTQEIYNALFQDLLVKKYSLENLISREYKCANGLGLIYSIKVGLQVRVLSIPIPLKVQKAHLPQWKGIHTEIVQIPEYGENNQLYLKFEQGIGQEAYIFEIIAEDIRRGIDALDDSQSAVDCILQIVGKWNKFFIHGRKVILSEAEEQGLFGELLFLDELIKTLGTNSVFYWESENSTHDFYIRKNAVEIKTCSTQIPYRAHINSAHQLDRNDVKGKLFLQFYALRKSKNGGMKLPEMADQIRVLLQKNILALQHFNEKLFRIGYLDEAKDYYDSCYTERERYSFEIIDGFPKISVRDIPPEIFNLQYELAVGQCLDFAISEKDLMKGVQS
ncbi:PD-(D/E)XK motif protein [Acidaminococcus fermentans]|jgi:hypothetical protein|uniref:PD-(D/E)XK motif protein n=1 Tax=Acidaminococcus fermentans TaxID=905 RepID=UPI002E762C74|nr:PD-(D/E)XK motif protein [Acidaminococcus fermentans]MEE1597768.1 PD-(D/E)XK motif protein [Acidaminococcus fermentans]MEE4122030.1 PD-(D/E)XK motif protein [Acidaminococcus fermentans]